MQRCGPKEREIQQMREAQARGTCLLVKVHTNPSVCVYVRNISQLLLLSNLIGQKFDDTLRCAGGPQRSDIRGYCKQCAQTGHNGVSRRVRSKIDERNARGENETLGERKG